MVLLGLTHISDALASSGYAVPRPSVTYRVLVATTMQMNQALVYVRDLSELQIGISDS